MSVRLLLGVLGPMFSGDSNESTLIEIETSEKASAEDFQTPVKFHIGMLSISLIIGLAFGGFIIYKIWEEKNIFLGYIRNLILALVCRTFFSILFDGVILLGSPLDVAGGNTLQAFEQIFINLVLAFWLTLTIYIHARVKTNFNSEPTLRLYKYGIPGVAVFFALIWIFTWQSQVPSTVWWIYFNPFGQWIVNSVNLLFLLIQLTLVGDIVRMMMKISLDNDSVSLLRIIAILMGALILIFWLEFGFVLEKIPFNNSSAYIYFHYLIDGLECALVCTVLYFFSKWVFILLNKISSLMILNEEPSTSMSTLSEILLTGHDDRRIMTIDSVFMTSESKRWKISEEDGTKDVVYSNVVEPQRLKKTLELYKRFDIIPSNRVTVVEGEKFYDCQTQRSFESKDGEESQLSPKQHLSLQVPKRITTSKDINLKSDTVREQTQKKNAFYSSKYLILDSKENDFPKYLETRPSVSSLSGKDSLKEERLNKNFASSLDSLMSEELVRKWLFDNSENMQINEKSKTGKIPINRKENSKASKNENLDLEISIHKSAPETILKTEGKPEQNQTSVPQTTVTTISSILSNMFFRSSKRERRNSNEEKSVIPALNEIKTTVSEQKDAKKIAETVCQLKTEMAKPQQKSDLSDDTVINKDISLSSGKKSEIVTNSKEIEKFHSENQSEVIKTSEDDPSEFSHTLKPESKEGPKEFKKESIKLKKEQKLNRANDTESILCEENNSKQSIYLESLEFQSLQHQLITKQQPQISQEELKKLTEFPLENKHHNDLDFETENKNIYETLNENEREEPESLESQLLRATGACKTENIESNEDVIQEPSRYLEPEVPLEVSEVVMKSADSTTEQKSKNTTLTASDEQNSNKPTELSDEYLTLSELLNFRSQRDKETVIQPSFSFSDAISVAIDSIINASGSFFFLRKNYPDKEKFQNIEGKDENGNDNLVTNNYQTPQNEIDEELENLQRLRNQKQDITHKVLNSEAENEHIYDSKKIENKTEEPESVETQTHNATGALKIENDQLFHVSESELETSVSVPDFKMSKLISNDTVEEQTSNFEKDIISPLTDNFNFLQPLEYQSQRVEPTTVQSSKDAENKVFNNSIEMELQSKTYKITKSTLNLKHKRENDSENHYQTHKSKKQKSFELPVVTKSDINTKQIQKPHVKQFEQAQAKRYRTEDLIPSESLTDMSEVSSDSEFSIEKRKTSSSSNGSFSLDRYYAELTNVRTKFQNPSGFVHNRHEKNRKL